MDQTLILVDEKDNFLGYASRGECHRGKGKRHRAFVTLLFDSQNRVLLQRRKHRLFDNLWDLTAISHPLHLAGEDEDYQIASDRALKKEMGIGHILVKKVGAFNYFARHGQDCENEYCAVLIGKYNGDYTPNPREVYEAKKIDFEEFVKDVQETLQKYTPWAKEAIKVLKDFKTNHFKAELEKFLIEFNKFSKSFFSKKRLLVKKYPRLIENFYENLEDFNHGGKAMRPFLVYLGYRVVRGKDLKKILPICLAHELIHAFLLIHDDIIDKSKIRRGKPTIHEKYKKLFDAHYGVSQAIVLGDMASFEALNLVVKADFEDSLKIVCLEKLLEVVVQTTYGQALDVEYSYTKPNLAAIRKMTDLKTARYSFVGPLTVGAILGRANKSQFKALANFGLAVGTAFQLQDDILGVFGDEKITGKSTLSDLVEGKNTLLIYKAKELAGKKEKKLLARLWGKENAEKSDLEQVKEIIVQSGALAWCDKKKEKLVDKAKSYLAKVTPDLEIKLLFSQMANFIIERQS